MNANNPVNLDQLADQLARQDGGGTAPPDSTLKELKQELDTLAVQVAQPAPENEFEGESALERGLEFVKEIGRELSAGGTVNVVSNQTPAEDLGSIREYKLLAKLGEGGMGAVYKALHTKLNKAVALKILPADRLQNESAVSRFEREMRAVGKLEHPNIVRATDAGEVDGKHYLVMELVNGIDLSNLVRKVGQASSLPSDASTDQPQAGSLRHEDPQAGSLRHGALTIPDACEMIRQAAIGLQEAHEDGMVHRDIKPSNLMLARSRKGRKPPLVKILDMGLALLDDHRGERRDLTSTGQMMGTLDYMAPEQGMDSHQVDIRADIYSLGATLHKLLTSQAPFPSDKYDNAVKMMVALATQQAPSIATVRDDLPPELAAIVDRMLARNPDERFAEPEEVAEALLPFCEGCDLAGLLESATEGDAESAEDESKVATHDSLKSDSVETAPTIDVQGNAPPAGEDVGVAGVAPAAFPSTATTAASPGGSLRSTPATQAQPATASPRSKGGWYTNRRNQVLIAAGLAGIILLAAIIIYIKTDNGTIVVEIDDPSISVTVQGEDIRITKNDSGEAYQIKPGEHTLHVKHGDLEFDTDKFKLSRSEKVVLSVRLVDGEVKVVQKDEEQTVIGSRPLGKTNFALSFDGESFVDISTVSLPDATKPFTLEAKVLSRRSVRGVVIKGANRTGLTWNDSDEEFGWWFATGSGEKRIEAHGFNELAANVPVHVAGVWTGSQARLFVNGKEVSNHRDTFVRAPLTKPFLFIGAEPKGVEPQMENLADGIIDEVRISSVARYDKDFTPAERFESDEHTLALYHFDEGQGEIAHDSSPNKHHGKIIGAKWVKANPEESSVAPRVEGPTGNRLAFNGYTSRVEIPELNYDGTHDLTLESWAQGRRNEFGFVVGDVNAGGVAIVACSSGWRFQFHKGPGNIDYAKIDSQTQIASDRFSHLAAVFTKGEARFYVNGRLNGRAPRPSPFRPSNQSFTIGADRDGPGNFDSFFEGEVDEVRISRVARYDKDFTPAERFEPDEHTLALYHFDEGQGEIAHDSSPNKHHGKIVGAKWVKADKVLEHDEAKVDYSLDRSVAEWALKPGGWIDVKPLASREAERIKSFPLPTNPFELRGIHLHRAPIPNGGLRDLAALTNLDSLTLVYCTGVQDSDVELLMELTSLRHLVVEIHDLSDRAFDNLAGLENIEVLSIPGTQITGRTVARFQHLPRLSEVSMYGCMKIADADLGCLIGCRNLRRLVLSHTRTTDAGLLHLASIPSLRSLNLDKTQVTVEGVAKFKLARPRCKIEQSHFTHFTEAQITAAMEKLTPERRAAIWALWNGGSVVLSPKGSEPITISDPKDLPKVDFDLLEFNLQGNEGVDDAGLEQLKSLANLRKLLLTKTKVTAAAVGALQKALVDCQIESDFTDEEIAAAMETLKSDEKKKE